MQHTQEFSDETPAFQAMVSDHFGRCSWEWCGKSLSCISIIFCHKLLINPSERKWGWFNTPSQFLSIRLQLFPFLKATSHSINIFSRILSYLVFKVSSIPTFLFISEKICSHHLSLQCTCFSHMSQVKQHESEIREWIMCIGKEKIILPPQIFLALGFHPPKKSSSFSRLLTSKKVRVKQVESLSLSFFCS